MKVKYKRMKTSKTTKYNKGWTLNKLYETNEEGKLVDDNNLIRLDPDLYGDYFLKVFIPEVGDIVRIKTREEMLRDDLIGENGRPASWIEYMEKHYYGRNVSVKEIDATGRFTTGDGYVMNLTAIAEIPKYKPVKITDRCTHAGFTIGKTYSINEDGKLIDDDGTLRCKPAHYDWAVFEQINQEVPETANTNKTIKENKMETTIKVNGEVSIVTEEAVVQEAPKTDLEQNYKYVVELYNATGTKRAVRGFRTKKEVKEFKTNFFKDPNQIGFALKVYKLIETVTTKIPVVTTKEKQ